MTFRREVEHCVNIIFPEDPLHHGRIADVSLHKVLGGSPTDALQVRRIPRISQLV